MLERLRAWHARVPIAGDLWLLGLFGLVLFGTGLGLRDPWPADEPRYALIARDMVASGDWLFPRVGGELYADKPPLFFWCIAALYWLTGSLRLSFLLPSMLAALGVLGLVYDLGRRLWDRRVGLAAGLALIATVQFALQARTAQIDMLLTFWTTLGLYGLARHLIDGPRWGWYAAGFFAMGLGVITKGVGFLPALVLLPWGWAAWRGWRGATRTADWRWVAGPLVLVVAIGLWVVPMLLQVAASGEPEYLAYRDEILLKQTSERYASAWHHVQPGWYYLVNVIPPLWLPLSLLLPWLVPHWWRALRGRELRLWLLLGWVLAVLVFFTLSPGKRGVYLLPALPATALAAAPYLFELWRRRGPHRTAFALTALLTAGIAAVFVYLRWLAPERTAQLVADYEIAPWPPLLALVAIGLFWLVTCRLRFGLAGLVGSFASLWLIYGAWISPQLDPVRSGRDLMEALEARWPAGRELGLVAWREQFLLYLERPVTVFGRRRFDSDRELYDAVEWLVAEPDRLLLIDETARSRCFEGGAMAVEFAARTQWYLVGPEALAGRCRTRGDPTTRRTYRPPG